MDGWLFLSLLLTLLSLTGEVEGALKPTTFGSLKNEKQNLCSTCRVIRMVGNHTATVGKKKVLKCSFHGISAENITWLKDGKRIRENSESLTWKTGRKLRIKKISVGDRGLYTCVGHSSQGLKITSEGYLKVQFDPHKASSVTRSSINPGTPKVGRCEQYRGKICSQYLSPLVFVDTQKPENSQEFIEKKLSFAYSNGSKFLSRSCRRIALSLWCLYHFPECVMTNSKAAPKMICRGECEQVMTEYCKVEYNTSKQAQSQSSGDDLFPDCSTLPSATSQGSCMRLLPQVKTGPTDGAASGRCEVYGGKVCKKFGKKIFLRLNEKVSDIEAEINNTLKRIERGGQLTEQCQPYIVPLLCELKLPDCDDTSSPPKYKPICKDECVVLKDQHCRKEYDLARKSEDGGIDFNCSSVQAYARNSGKCSVIGVPTDDSKGDTVPSKSPRVGHCAPYAGTICKAFIGVKRTVFVDKLNVQSHVEKKLDNAYKAIQNYQKLSPECKPFVLPLMCHHLFPYCDPGSSTTQPKPSLICRRDCLHIQHKFCSNEYVMAERQLLTAGRMLFPRCSDLVKSDHGCLSLRKLYSPIKTGPIPGDCYSEIGTSYRGFANTTESGISCQHWNTNGYPELLNDQNFCRNPGGKRERPWCLTAESDHSIGLCNIPKCVNAPLNGTGEDYLGTINKTMSGKVCEPWDKYDRSLNWGHNYCRNPRGSRSSPWCYVGENSWEFCEMPREPPDDVQRSQHLSELLYTVIPCVVFGLVVGTVIIAVCWKQHKEGPHTLNKNPRPTVTVFLPELRSIPAENITLAKVIGNGRFGTIYNGEIRSCDDSSHINRLMKASSIECRDEFIKQSKKWSQFHNPNVLTVEAISSGDDPVILVFEPASHGSLYQYLIHHSPNNPKFTKDHALLSEENLVDISRQVAAGMTYLSSHGYVHGDLMTRNCQVAHCMVIKITDFSIDRDVCYYRRLNKPPIPIGWLAPEAIQTEVFTVYSDIWAFGILLWEIFTYGFQPYFGYTFMEVRKKILDMDLLECPRDCIPFIYDLMRRCWNKNPKQRPLFFDLHEVLYNLSNELIVEEPDDSIRSYVGASSC